MNQIPDKCPKCEQSDHGQQGEYPCQECGLPLLWDDKPTILAESTAQPAVSPAQRAEFEALARPLIKWLNDNWHPHVTVVVSTTHAELLEGMIGLPITDYVRD